VRCVGKVREGERPENKELSSGSENEVPPGGEERSDEQEVVRYVDMWICGHVV